MTQQFGAGRERERPSSDDTSFEAVPLPKLDSPTGRPPRWPKIPYSVGAAMEEPDPERNESTKQRLIRNALAEGQNTAVPVAPRRVPLEVVNERLVLNLDGSPKAVGSLDNFRNKLSSVLDFVGLERLAETIQSRTLINVEGPLTLSSRRMIGLRWESQNGDQFSRLCRANGDLVLGDGEVATLKLVGNRIFYKDDIEVASREVLNATPTTELIKPRR